MDTCEAIWEVLHPLYMIPPTVEKWKEIARRFEELWNYPNCCGAIDGKHVRLECPVNAGSAYFNYKNFHSIVLQGVVDADAKFIAVDVGDYGRNSDSGIFGASHFGQAFYQKRLNLPVGQQNEYNLPYVFVGDEAYPLTPNLMKPFPKKALTREKRIYNYRHSRARRVVECAFGILTKKFRVFETTMLVTPETANKITLACCVLHNMLREKEGKPSDIHQELLDLQEDDNDQDEVNLHRGSNTAYAVRNKYVDFFNSNYGSVPWQNKIALFE